MRTHPIGGVQLSAVGLGGFEFGEDPSWAGATQVVEAAVDCGIDWVDTAEVYFDRMNEKVIGAAVQDAPLRVSSKVAPKPNGTGLEPDQVRTACAASLERLGRDHLDIYLVHFPDRSAGPKPIESTWEAMRSLVDEGVVSLVGLSNFDRTAIERCLQIGPVDLVQDGLCAIDHLDNRELFAWCAERNIAVVTYEPLGNGMLAGAISKPEDFARVVGEDYQEWPFWQRLFSPGKFEKAKLVTDRMRDVADEVGCSLAQLALAWNLHQRGVTHTLAGSTNPHHVRDNAAAVDVELTPAQLDCVEDAVRHGPTFD